MCTDWKDVTITIKQCVLAHVSFGTLLSFTYRTNLLQRRPTRDYRHAHAIRIPFDWLREGVHHRHLHQRRRVLSSAYVVQIDSSRESFYLMRLPNGVRLKRCSHHRRKSPPRRLQPSSILFRFCAACLRSAGRDVNILLLLIFIAYIFIVYFIYFFFFQTIMGRFCIHVERYLTVVNKYLL